MRIAVIDGQGGGIGKALVERLSKICPPNAHELIALGTNANATAGMMKAGAHVGATGENAIRVTSGKVDLIVGPIAIVMTDSMMGEITAQMSMAISGSDAVKVLIPMNRCNVYIAGTTQQKLQDLIDQAVVEIEKYL